MEITEYYKNIKRPLVLDGAIGSLLQQRGVITDKVLWSSLANVIAPEEVIKLHREYINAGAEIITTNTFRTNPTAYEQSSLKISISEFIKKSVELTRIAKGKTENIFIAGSNPPAEDSYQSSRKLSRNKIEANHKTHIDLLWENGVDFVLNETQSHLDEIKIICEHCNRNKIPFIVSLFINFDGKLLSGEPIDYVLDYLYLQAPIAVGINCVAPVTFKKIMTQIIFKIPWGYYLNCGSGKYTDAEIFEGVSTTEYIGIVDKYLEKNPLFIGTCCGSNPQHTKKIKEYLIGKYNGKSIR